MAKWKGKHTVEGNGPMKGQIGAAEMGIKVMRFKEQLLIIKYNPM